jgi:tRNA G18 (ribose-2'-O)-methylase SpoU
MATVFTQKLYYSEHARRDIEVLIHDGGYRAIATTLAEDAMPIDQVQLDGRPIVLMMGNESSGLSEDLQSVATDRVTIPMKIAVDSLNVSVAAGIFLYGLTRLSTTNH